MENAIARVPALETAGVKQLLNGPESFTPDGNFILGEAPELRNLLCRRRLQRLWHRLGRRGRAWRWPNGWRRARRPTTCGRWTSAASARCTSPPIGCATRTLEAYGKHYTIAWPSEEMTVGPAHPALAALRASEGGGGLFRRKAGLGAAELVCRSGRGRGAGGPLLLSAPRLVGSRCGANIRRRARRRC